MSLKSIGTLSTVLKSISDGSRLSAESISAMSMSLKGMSEAQIAATVSASGLSASQVASALSATGMNEALVLEKLALMGFSKEAAIAAVVSDNFSREEAEAAVAGLTFAAAETTATAATGGLSTAIAGLGTVIAANPIGAIITAITVVIALIPIAINLFKKFHKSTEELKQEYDDLASGLDGLNSELKTTRDRIAELQKLSNDGKITLVEQEELNKLLETNAQLERQIRLQEEAAQKAAEEANKSLVKDYNKQSYSSISGTSKMIDAGALYEQYEDEIKLYQEMANGWLENWDKLAEDEKNRIIELYNEYDRLLREGNNEQMYPFPKDTDEYIQELIDRYKELDALGSDITENQKWQMDEIRSELLELGNVLQKDFINEFVGEGETLDSWNALADAIDACINPAQHFTTLLENMPSNLKDILNTEGTNGELTAERINELAGQYQELSDWLEKSGFTAEEVASHYNALNLETEKGSDSTGHYTAQLSDLTEVLSDLQDSYDALESAQEDMAGGGGLSADTINDLAAAEENYLDYLYEENGVIKLNTEAWKENANAKMKGEIAEIQKEIDSMEDRNAALRESIEYYKEQQKAGNDGGIWSNLIRETTAELEKNTEAVEANQSKIGLYQGILDGMIAKVGQWKNTLNTFDNATSNLEKLASVQAALTEGYTISAAKAREFAGVYPEILNEAMVSADGQITLNKSVVNSFIEGKEAEIKAGVQAEAEKLKAKEALLQAELGVIEAQIEAAESSDDAKVKSANEAASAKMALEQAVLTACEQAGIDETTANQMALAAMTDDWDTFKSLATQAVYDLDDDSATAFNNVMTNFAATSQNMVDNTNEVISAFSQMGRALKNAMEGIETARYEGKTTAGAVSGSGREAVNGLLSDMFEAGKSDYSNAAGGAYEDALNAWQMRLQEIVDSYAATEPDMSALYTQRDKINAQIAEVQNQIGLLESLGNTSLDKFNSSSSSKGSSGSSSSSSKSEAKGWLDTLNDLDGGISSLSGALKELNENGSVSTKTLSGLSGVFGKLSSFNTAINAMGKSGATLGEAQEACNALAEELINTSGILNMVTEENAEVIASALESMGVTNARTLVLRKFNSTSAATIVAENGLADAAWEQVDALLRSKNVTEEEINALRVLRQEQYNAALAAVDFSKANAGVTETLIKQAKAAGASSGSIEALTKIQRLQAMGKAQAEAQGYLDGAASFEEALRTLADRARIEIGDIDVSVPDVNVNVEVSNTEGNGCVDGSEVTVSNESATKSLSTTVKAWEAAVYRFTEATEKLRKSTEAITKAEADIDMTNDPRERLVKQIGLVDDYKQSMKDMAALSQEVRDEIAKQVEAVKNSGIEVIYKADNNELSFPNQKSEETLDQTVEAIDRERIALEELLASPNFAVSETGNKEIDTALHYMSDTLNKAQPMISKLNELIGSQYSYEDFREKRRANGAVRDGVGESFYTFLRQKMYEQGIGDPAVLEREAEAAYEEITNLFCAFDARIDNTTMNLHQIWKTLEDPNSVFAKFVPASDGGWNDSGKADINSYNAEQDAFKSSIKNLIDDSIKLNEENQKRDSDMLEAQKKIHSLWKDILDTIADVVKESGQSLDDIQNVYSTLKSGAKEFSENGYLSIDTYQKILELGPQYMQFLVDENGQWVINEDRIRAVTAAKAEQLALDNAWAYVERLKLALQEDAIENLNELLYSTIETAEGTWELVYANLAMLNLSGEQYKAALHNIQVMRDLAFSAVEGINVLSETTSNSISDMSGYLNDLLKYVEEVIKQEVKNQVEALENQVDEMKEIVSLQKKSLDLEKEKDKYTKSVADKEKAIADLRKQIAALDLDDSREAAAKKAALQEELSEKINALADYQSDHAYNSTSDMLDDMADAYEKEKQTEIDILENSISSEEKVYRLAIDRINNHWDTLYQDLINWNYEYGLTKMVHTKPIELLEYS